MIRIDEIYNNTFWPWIHHHHPGVRMYMCDPFGRSDPDSVKNFGRDDIQEHNYIFFFDQEPIHLDLHLNTFDEVKFNRNPDLHDRFKNIGAICTSEKNSETVDAVCKKYNWQSYYYFFHGWAALDWYRGYDKTFLIRPWNQRSIRKTFLAPNRIVAGRRQHRLEMLYYIFKYNMLDNHVSCPVVCPAENISIHEAVKKLSHQYSDIETVFSSAPIPLKFNFETDHPMHSCWLSLFDESAESLLYLVTETIATGHRHHLTEKTFKPIATGMPFIIVGTRSSLEYLRSYGFKTFNDLWDESYDYADDQTRIKKIADLLHGLNQLSVQEKQNLFERAIPIIEHNWNHFYHGSFETILWQELMSMLNDFKFTN